MRDKTRLIRIGVMCNSLTFPAWQARALKHLLNEKDLQIKLLIFDARKAQKSNFVPLIKNQFSKIKFSTLFWHLYNKFFVKRFSKSNQPVDLQKELEEVPVLSCIVNKKGKFSEYFSKEDIQEIKSYQLDFIVRFGFGIIRGDILNAAKFGIWSYHHDDIEKYRGSPPCFWEIYQQDNVTGSVLQRLNNRLDGGTVLMAGYLKTSISYIKNRDQLFFESADWLRRASLDIKFGQTKNLQKNASKTKAPIYKAPRNYQMVLFFLIVIKRFFKKAFKSLLYTDYWNIGIANVPIQHFLNSSESPDVTWFPDIPKDRFYADPFGLYEDGKVNLLYEVFPFRSGTGKLAAMQFNGKGFKHLDLNIQEPFHLSYPFLLHYDNSVYCVPETYQAGQVRLYKALDFPTKWNFHSVLIDNYSGIDNTLFHYQNTWWMFSTDKNAGPHYRLNLFYSDDLFGTWQPHPKNPVKTDIRSCRPAGNLFEHGGKLYRPAMDYSEKVEGRIILNEIQILTKTDFKEIRTKVINPFSNTYFSDKIHTLCDAGPFTIIDGAKELFVLGNWHAFKYKVRSKIKKIKL